MLEINTSKIKNTVTFSVDKDSLKKAKDSITGLKEFAENIKPAKLRFDNVTKGYKKAQSEVDKIAQQKAKTEKQNQRAQAAAARAQARQQAQIAARSEKAALKLLDVGSSISAMHRLSVAEQYKAIAQAREIAKQYEQGAISLARMNSQMKRLQQQQRKINGNRKAQLAPVKGGGSGNSATMGALLFGGATAAAGVMAVSKTAEFVSNSFANAETQGELIQRARLGGVDVNQMYNITEWAYRNGVDSMMGDQGARKYLDQMKDVRERAAKSYSEAEYVVDKKTGKGGEWKGGDNAINELLNIGVINKSDLKKFADNPAGLISKAVNGMMKKGFSDSQIGQRLEDLGDDLMLTSKYWQRSVKDVQESINQQKASGKWLTETQQDSIVKFRELNRQLSQLSDARQVAFVDGFMKSLDPKVTEEFMKNLSNLTPYFTKLGEATGSLFEAIMKIVNWFNRNDDKTDAIQKNMGDAPPLSNDGMKQNLSNLVPDQYKGAGTATTAPDNSHSLFNTLKGWLFDDKSSSVSDVKMSVSEAPITNLKQGALNNLAMTTPAYNLSPVFNLNPTFEVVTEVPLTINSDTSRLSDYVDFTARASRDSFLKSLTLTSLSGQSNGG
ncbi:hypothetical protein NMK96_09460 [Escherichia coli]|uniref:hypothetical protein n=1 Tax=Escherichia coli TaxID=562 RepID=UPI0001E17E4F|nr:hypothetical protein [Escherichia coli]ANJ39269.1 hypothetical protein A9Z04_06850 [Escherichia coli]AVZ57863.1 hypothetical protein DBZ19_09585 [Escherichia coli]EFM54722.1 hypothetical protein ECNC101_10044 [Escherichia coli NC101]EFN9659103.1 hypothetical protein [Escherichia coli]EGO4260451.1 hypothetical protein [Escherichia coli]